MHDPTLNKSERFLPYLLDRLTDDEPEKQTETRNARVLTQRQLRRSVLQDVRWLLNTTKMMTPEQELEFPRAAKSVINYGVVDLAGRTASGMGVRELERHVQQALQTYEPRLIRHTLSVRSAISGGPNARPAHSQLGLEIRGEIWATPQPDSMYIKTELDLETGQCDFEDGASNG